MIKLRIDHYTFGRITVNGRKFTSDIIIHANGRVQDNWWRKKGHELVPEDIGTLLDNPPRRLIIGTGSSGLMLVSERVMELCRERGIEVESFSTPEAVQRFNEFAEKGASVAACFHLTC